MRLEHNPYDETESGAWEVLQKLRQVIAGETQDPATSTDALLMAAAEIVAVAVADPDQKKSQWSGDELREVVHLADAYHEGLKLMANHFLASIFKINDPNH